MSPARRRRAVAMLCDCLDVSERWACRVVGQHRSTQRYSPTEVVEDMVLRARLRQISAGRPRWGYRRAHQLLVEDGFEINRKRTQRLWREEGLRVPQRTRKRRRLGESAVAAGRLRAERPRHVWALDFQHDQTADGRALRILNVVDEYTREALAMHVDRSITAGEVVTVLEHLVCTRGAPTYLRCDNGTELTARAHRLVSVLRDVDELHRSGLAVAKRVRGVLQRPRPRRASQRRGVLLLGEARVVIGDWHEDYNTRRPHSALGMRTPAAFAAAIDGRASDRAA